MTSLSALPVSPPPPRVTAEQAVALRKDLEATGWGVDAVAHLLGSTAAAALRREIRQPALRAVRNALNEDRQAGATPSSTAILTALFMLGQPVAATELDAVLPRTRARGANAIGLITTPDQDGQVRARVDLRPHEVSDEAGTVRWWVASDLGELVTGQALAADHVLGIGGAGLTLAGLTPRIDVDTALDLGCGCGIQTLYLLRHAQHVTATDISARALAFTAFNTALAGEAHRVELLAGSLTEPVAGRRFDLIATNPPFVLTPPAVRAAGLPLMEYRDAGAPVLPGLVRSLGAHLNPGGVAVALGNWEHERWRDWREEVGAWIPPELDAWIIQREVQDPVEYATMWLRDGGLTPERNAPAFDAALEAWIADFAQRRIESIGFGYLILAAGRDRAPWRILEEVSTSGQGPLGPHITQVLAVQDYLSRLDDDAVAQLHPVAPADVTEERHHLPGQSEPSAIILCQGGALGRRLQVSTVTSALVGVADGELSLAQIAAAVASLSGLDEAGAQQVRAEMVAALRDLARQGFLGVADPSQVGSAGAAASQ